MSGWTQVGLDIDGGQRGSVAISNDGTIIAIGNHGVQYGTVSVYEWNGTSWTAKGIPITGNETLDNFGQSVSLSSDGTILAIGAVNTATGQKADYVKIYEWNGSSWIQKGSTLSSDGDDDDHFGFSVSLSSEES